MHCGSLPRFAEYGIDSGGSVIELKCNKRKRVPSESNAVLEGIKRKLFVLSIGDFTYCQLESMFALLSSIFGLQTHLATKGLLSDGEKLRSVGNVFCEGSEAMLHC